MSKQNHNEKQPRGDLAERIASLMPLRRFGWSFLLAWVFCVFYTEVVNGYIGDTSAWLPDSGFMELFFFTGFPVFMSVIMLVIIVCSEKHFGSPTDHPALFLIVPAATALSTPLLFWLTGSPGVTFAMFVVGSILTGFGSGFMWVMWGEFFSKTSQGDAEFLAPISAIVAALLVLLVSAMDGWVALAFVTTLPLLSGLCFYLSWKDVQDHTATAEHLDASGQQAFKDARDRAKGSLTHVLGSMGRVGFGILVACLFVCLLGTFSSGLDKHSLPFQIVLIGSIVFMVVVSFASTLGPRRISISFLYRWMCPVLVVGFASLIVFDASVGGYIALMISVAARFA
ncbi:MAG: LuxR family transcriptional regulator, partial [Raoultibacter sp.]